mmetsp:Transcript_342/g.484  ORF Transcript_342/g.484 Transcript_342/m.484 type:complete len:219 (-) Transcript_342:1335-1991(-)
MILLSILALSFMVRFSIVFDSIQKHRNSLERSSRGHFPVKTLVVLGSGGHTTEMLQMIKNLDQEVYNPLVYVIAKTDETSEPRLRADGGLIPSMIHYIPRSREVGQSYFSSLLSTIWAIFWALWLVGKIRPNLLLCNGPGTCLPIALATLFFRVLGLCEGNIVFIESFCRVESLSLTGKLLYPLADMFVIHWCELKKKYPLSCTVSTFVPNETKAKLK